MRDTDRLRYEFEVAEQYAASVKEYESLRGKWGAIFRCVFHAMKGLWIEQKVKRQFPMTHES